MRAALLLAAMLVVACKGTIMGPLQPLTADGPGVDDPSTPGDGSQPPVITSQAAVCSTGPKGRSYKSLDGHPLEYDRANVDLGVDIARLPTSGQLIETQRGGLGQDFYQLHLYTREFGEAFGQQEGLTLRGWFQPTTPGISLAWTFFYSSYRACLEAVTNPQIYQPPEAWTQTPTAQTAPVQCRRWMMTLWWDLPTEEQVADCADFAVNEIPTLAQTPAQQWAYVCASIMSSAAGVAY